MRTILEHQLNKIPPDCIHAMANRVQGCVFGYDCGYCDKIFTQKHSLIEHQRHSCPYLNTQPYPKFVCFECHQQVSKSTFYNHRRGGCPIMRRRARLHEQPIHFLCPFRMPGLNNAKIAPMFWTGSSRQSLSRRMPDCV